MFTTETAERLGALVSPLGPVAHTSIINGGDLNTPHYIAGTATGDLTRVLEGVRRSTGGMSTSGTIDGAGGSVRGSCICARPRMCSPTRSWGTQSMGT